jgi:hypothetical protein
MPVEAIAEPEILTASDYPKRKRWTRAECAVLARIGVVDTGKLELIEGDLIERMKNRRKRTTNRIPANQAA